ncbi:MAG: hypothetical protein IKX23_11015 [Treponema sp.]|nr:hypothetical protein [Treponema sp.]
MNSIKRIVFLVSFSFLFFKAFCNSSDGWIIAAQKFSFSKPAADSVSEGISMMFPSRILEKLSTNLSRTVDADEKLARQLFLQKNERNSLFLQLSAEVQKKDALVLGNYSNKELSLKLNEADKKIQGIREKIDENLQKQKELELQYLHPDELSHKEKSSFMNFLSNDDTAPSLERIVFYNNDYASLYEPSEESRKSGYLSKRFENEIYSKKINALITGTITKYSDYVKITVELYLYPGAKLIASVTEVGNLNEADLISTSIARELSPAITNAIPVKILLTVENEVLDSKLEMYIDDVLQSGIPEEFIIDSGIHYIQFIADGYDSAGASYAFSGNKIYSINVLMKKTEQQNINITLAQPSEGDFFSNGQKAEKLTEEYSRITINGKEILGEFIASKDKTVFFYIPADNLEADKTYMVTANPENTSAYIEKHRRKMYFSYSMLITSVIPLMVTRGQYQTYANTSSSNENELNAWHTASIVSAGITIGCGVWFVYELVRYLIAADSVLPKQAVLAEDFKFEDLQSEEVQSTDDIEAEKSQLTDDKGAEE